MGALSCDLPVRQPVGPANGDIRVRPSGPVLTYGDSRRSYVLGQSLVKTLLPQKRACPLRRSLYDNGYSINHGHYGGIVRYGKPDNAAIPATDARRERLAWEVGRYQ